jgi:hypothetical protein
VTSPALTTESKGSLLKQPRAVWAVAFACVISFMGLGLVDPILTAIAKDLNASSGDVSLLFTSYLVVTAVAMLITGWVSSRIGVKWTLISGLALIVVFAALGGMAWPRLQRRPRRLLGRRGLDRRCPRLLGPRQRAVHRDLARDDRQSRRRLPQAGHPAL